MSTKINARSPFYIKIQDNDLASVILNLYIWDGDSSDVTDIKYTFDKDAIGTNDYVIFEIADYVRDYIETEYNSYSTNAVWVKWTYQIYDSAGDEVGDLETSALHLGMDGYGYFEDGSNPQLSRDLLQSNRDVYYLDGRDIVVPVFAEDVDSVALSGTGVSNVYWEQIDSFWEEYEVTWDAGSTGQDVVDSTDSHFKVVYVKITDTENLANTTSLIITKNDESTITVTLHKICELKYTPLNVIFYNKFGAMQNLWFFKKSTSSINVTGEKFKRNIIDSDGEYNVAKHQMKSFNVNATENLTLNTGFLPEDFNDVIRQLMLSEEVWLDNGTEVLPIMPVTNSLTYKTNVNDKLINYTMEFQYAFDKVNNIR